MGNRNILDGTIITPVIMEIFQQSQEVTNITYAGLSEKYSNHWNYKITFTNGKSITVCLPYRMEAIA